MQRIAIPVDKFQSQNYTLFSEKWFLLTGGDYQKHHFNTMTIEWGSIGKIWRQPLVQVFVRPSRYTYQFMEQYHTFTLSSFPRQYKDALLLLGTKSGRDGDKIAEAGLTPEAASRVAAPVFAQAELTIECVKIYWDDIVPAQMVDEEAFNRYGNLPDPHRVYFGKIVAIYGTHQYQSAT
ncbi:MAG: flavin reductase [Anaerolineaceae bacterium]|nr:flavin reductase [Anaerolineaceae bacterium]